MTIKFVFSVVLWSEDGNTLIESKRVTIRRAKQNTAKDYLIKKYPRPYFIERYS